MKRLSAVIGRNSILRAVPFHDIARLTRSDKASALNENCTAGGVASPGRRAMPEGEIAARPAPRGHERAVVSNDLTG